MNNDKIKPISELISDHLKEILKNNPEGSSILHHVIDLIDNTYSHHDKTILQIMYNRGLTDGQKIIETITKQTDIESIDLDKEFKKNYDDLFNN